MIDYGYETSGWKDLLMSYGTNQNFEYDAIGNPTKYGNITNLAWEGRQLSSLTKNGVTTTYKYDADGLRLQKTSGGATTQYRYVGGQLLEEIRDTLKLSYTYDALGNLAAIRTTIGSTTASYYVRTKLNGDVEQIYDKSGNLLARYIYDTWGNTVSIKNASGAEITDANHIANRNPIRYRGYYWDSETGFYYLQSRYYDPEVKRFINADGVAGMNAGAAYNLFSYCGNAPVGLKDSSGNYPVQLGFDRTEYGTAQTIEEWAKANNQYIPDWSPNNNCYGYALKEKKTRYVAGTSAYMVNGNVDAVAADVIKDVEALGRKAHIIDSYDSPIAKNEYRIALRVSALDYHFLRQDEDGTWSHKPGPYVSQKIDAANPDVFSWIASSPPSDIMYAAEVSKYGYCLDPNDRKLKYTSPKIIYFAISE